MLPDLSPEQRLGLKELGSPFPLYDSATQEGYILFPASISSDSLGGFQASISGFRAVGGGDTHEETLLALSIALRSV